MIKWVIQLRETVLTPMLEAFSMQYQGCQMVCFQNKNPNMGKLRRALE
jgi:hypothetical protein